MTVPLNKTSCLSNMLMLCSGSQEIKTLSSNVQKLVSVRVVYLWHSAASKNPFENGEAASNNHVVADVLHDASGLASHQSEQDRG